jgi:hypothetical protein
MQRTFPGRTFVAAILAILAAACSPPVDNPYTRIADAPLTRATLHAVTLVTTDDNLVNVLGSQGYTRLQFQANYPGAHRVHAALWGVPEEVAAAVAEFAPPPGGGPNLRVLVYQPGDRKPDADATPELQQAFFRNVLGTELPRWPDAALTAGAHIRSWSFMVRDVVDAAQRLRAAGIPVTFSPVGITTPMLGDHRIMATRAPDGTVIELVQTSAG